MASASLWSRVDGRRRCPRAPGWNDGKTESFAFTAIDRLATGGLSIMGKRWRRPFDSAGSEMTFSGLRACMLNIWRWAATTSSLGDGQLTYGPESISEGYDSARLLPGFFASLDLQRVWNPAYNQDCGPVWISSVRLHMEVGKNSFRRGIHP